MSDHLDATERAQRVLRGEEPPPAVELEFRPGCAMDSVGGRLYCGRCGHGNLAVIAVTGWPSDLSAERSAILLRCRGCGEEQAVTVSDERREGATIETVLSR